MSTVLQLEAVACPLCGGREVDTLGWLHDVALGVPGRFPLARCRGCGLLHQNPRVREDQLDLAYPDNYPAHARDAEMPRILRRAGPAVRWALATQLGYAHLDAGDPGPRGRAWARLRRRKIRENFPPWIGQGRLLDVGCATGRFLHQMKAVGWRVAGVEIDPVAAAKAKSVTPDVFVGDPVEASFASASFDVVTSFHVVEHLPRPLAALEQMLRWLTPTGLMIVEVPNAGGAGGRMFGRYWSGLDFPRHLTHFTPATMAAMVERAGGRVIGASHRTKPRYLTRSLRHWLRDQPGTRHRIALAALDSGFGRGAAKLTLELLMPINRRLGLGEAVRYFIRRA
ncbi:MAG TPA: class I SAM-dependent methyltransferase [Methylomirabilota bacterium]|nr:class I SAM-dependent methyltransferase [Methylomirabilota bacterium]